MIILGNGFDRACGLDSSYADFFKYLDEPTFYNELSNQLNIIENSKPFRQKFGLSEAIPGESLAQKAQRKSEVITRYIEQILDSAKKIWKSETPSFFLVIR